MRSRKGGVVIEKTVEAGQTVAASFSSPPLVTIAELKAMKVDAWVDEADIGSVLVGQEVEFQVDAYPNRPFRGQVLKIEPMAETAQNVTMFPVLVRIANTDGLLRPGMNAEVEVHVGESRSVIAVPNAALRTQRDYASAGIVLGLEPETVEEQLAMAREAAEGGQASMGGTTTRV